MQALQVTLFSDGRPGHVKQSLGIVKALQAYVEVNLDRVEVPSRSLPASLFSHISYLLNLGQVGESQAAGQADLFIGAGSRTHVPMLATGKKYGAKIVTCMSPAAHLRAKFDLCCVPHHDQVQPADNIFVTIGPPNLSQHTNEHDENRSLVLVGGEDESSHRWDEQGLVAELRSLISQVPEDSWLISSSPRTPESTENLIRQDLGGLPQVKFVAFSETASGWVEEMYRTHAKVWITADSISMVYEALSAGCRVGILPVDWRRKNNKFQRSLDYLLDQRRIVMLSQFVQGDTEWLVQDPLNEADRCAREILQRWWPKNLQ